MSSWCPHRALGPAPVRDLAPAQATQVSQATPLHGSSQPASSSQLPRPSRPPALSSHSSPPFRAPSPNPTLQTCENELNVSRARYPTTLRLYLASAYARPGRPLPLPLPLPLRHRFPRCSAHRKTLRPPMRDWILSFIPAPPLETSARAALGTTGTAMGKETGAGGGSAAAAAALDCTCAGGGGGACRRVPTCSTRRCSSASRPSSCFGRGWSKS